VSFTLLLVSQTTALSLVVRVGCQCPQITPNRFCRRRNEPAPAGKPRVMSASVQGPPRGVARPVGEDAYQHGNPRSWVLAAVIAAFMAAGIAIIVQLWWLFWLSAAVVVLSVPARGLIPRTLTGNHRQL
jgi:hypothetical protein